jgi:hypothetical protein
MDELDLAGLGFPVLPPDADSAEFDAVLDALHLGDEPHKGSRRAVTLAVAGSNGAGLRTALAINLALCAARRGVRVALIDAAERNAKLTRAIRRAARTPILNNGAFYRAADQILLALPKGFDPEIGRVRPDELLQSIGRLGDQPIELIICDGPDPGDGDAGQLLALVDEVIVLEEATDGRDARWFRETLAEADVAVRAVVRFDFERPRRQMRA